MNISGGPEELATFIRSLNDEPIYLVQERPAPRHVHPRPRPRRTDGWVTPAVCCAGAAIFGAIASYAYLFGA